MHKVNRDKSHVPNWANFRLATGCYRVQSCVMLRRKKILPASSRRNRMKAEEMRNYIHSFCGIFKQKPGEKSVVQELIEERRAERDRENRWEPKSKSTG